MPTVKYTLQLDRLTLSLSLNSENSFSFTYIQKTYLQTGNNYSLSNNISLRKTTKRLDKYFLHSFEVWIENKRIGTLHTDSRLPQADNVGKLEFSNYIFYSKPGFLYYLQRLQAVGLYVKTISYCEIALDIQLQKPLLPRLSHIERHSTLDTLNPNPKYRPLRVKTTCSKLNNGSEYVFGNKATGKTIAVYDKTQQLEDEGNKEYITDYHEAHGLDITKTIERVEARIISTWFAKNELAISEIDLSQPETLKTLFIKALGDSFKFVDINTPEKPKRNAQGNYTLPTKDLLSLSFLQSQPVELTKSWKVGEESDLSDNRKRIAYRALVDAFISQGTPEAKASMSHFSASQNPPKKTTWAHLTSRYAMQFEGIPTPDSNARIDSLNALLPPI